MLREQLDSKLLSTYPQIEMIVGAGEGVSVEFIPRPAVVRNLKSGLLRMDFGTKVMTAPGEERPINQKDKIDVISEAPEWID